MNLHLAEISNAIAPGAHAALLVDQTGWHLSDKLVVPPNIWQFMRDNWLSNRVFQSYENILDHCCYSGNKLVGQPLTIMSIGLREWAHRF
jgi:hypothetical protein